MTFTEAKMRFGNKKVVRKFKLKIGNKLRFTMFVVAILSILTGFTVVNTLTIWYDVEDGYKQEYTSVNNTHIFDELKLFSDQRIEEFEVPPIDINYKMSIAKEFNNNMLESGKRRIAMEEERIAAIPIYDIPLSDELQIYTYEISQEARLSYELVLGVMWHETGGTFNPKLRSRNPGGCYDEGLMQINDKFTNWYASLAGYNEEEFDVFDPKQNIRAGIYGLLFWQGEAIKYGFEGEDLFYGTVNMYNAGYQYPEWVSDKGYVYSRPYDQRVLSFKTKLERGGLLR